MDPKCIHKCSHHKEPGEALTTEEVEDVITEQGVGVMAGRGHESRNVGGLQKLGKAKKQILSWILQKERALPTH